jgi:hypothetical protein
LLTAAQKTSNSFRPCSFGIATGDGAFSSEI